MAENEFTTYKKDDQSQIKDSDGKKKEKKRNALAMILNGDFLTFEFIVGNLGFILFVFFLLILALAKNYYSEGLEDQIINKQRTIDELSQEYIDTKSKLEFRTQRVSLSAQLDSLGLKETKNATKVIRLK